MRTRSSARNIFPPLDNPELTIRRRSRSDPTLLNNSEMAAKGPRNCSNENRMAKINKNLMRVLQVNQQVKVVTQNCETCGGPHSFSDCPATIGNTQLVYAVGAYQVASVSRSTTGEEEEVVVGIVGPGYAVPLRVVIPFRSSFGLVIVLPGRVPKSKDEAITVALWLVRITLIGSYSINQLSVANGGWTIGEGMRTTTSFTVLSNYFHLLVNLKNSHKILVDFRHSVFIAAISVLEEEVIELDDSLRWVEVSQSLCSIDGITMSQSQTVIEGDDQTKWWHDVSRNEERDTNEGRHR
nr:hypothetical protein [Tanacetum cinerariifolium]